MDKRLCIMDCNNKNGLIFELCSYIMCFGKFRLNWYNIKNIITMLLNIKLTLVIIMKDIKIMLDGRIYKEVVIYGI